MFCSYGLVLVVGLVLSATSAAGSQLGLQNKNGVLVKDGKPFRGVGVNYFNCFYRTLKDANDTSYRQGFKVLAEHKIPFARFMACGYWPSENELYFRDKEAYFKLMDGVVKSAEENGVGLIPSLFFHYGTVADLVNEPICEWGTPNSKTIAFMRQYTKEIVTRYKNSPAIWGWEFGNEFMLAADLHMPEHRPPVWPTLGTAKSRSEKDEMTSDHARFAYKAFAEEARKYDKSRIILSGDSLPRPAAWHRRHERSWKQDSKEQFAEMLLANNKAMDVVCGHLYGDSLARFDRALRPSEVLRVALDVAGRAGKPLVIEEFGSDEKKGAEVAREEFEKVLSAIERTRVPMAALWVYDFDGQKDTYNVTATSRAYQLQAISEANARMSQD